MTKALPFTRASLKRAIRAARESGLEVVGIKPDGTIITERRTKTRKVPTVQTGWPPDHEWEGDGLPPQGHPFWKRMV